MMMNIKEYWDYEMACGRGYDKVRNGWSKTDFEARSDDTIANYLNLNKGYRVAEIGCAMAYACKIVAPKVKEYVGIDFSAQMIEEAKVLNSDFKNTKFVVNDGLTLPFEDDSFDIVFCELCFQHMSREQMTSNIMEIKRVVKPEGGVALQFPTPRISDGQCSPALGDLQTLFPSEKIKSYQHYIYVYTPEFVEDEVKHIVDNPQHVNFV
jgi:ubiquinone/menaquinone biosynthesis C-methylase UbiE